MFYLLEVIWKDVIALYSCFEAMVWKDTIALHLHFEVSSRKLKNLSWLGPSETTSACCSVKKHTQRSREGNQLTENNNNQGVAEKVEEHNQNMVEEDYPNLFGNLLD